MLKPGDLVKIKLSTYYSLDDMIYKDHLAVVIAICGTQIRNIGCSIIKGIGDILKFKNEERRYKNVARY